MDFSEDRKSKVVLATKCKSKVVFATKCKSQDEPKTTTKFYTVECKFGDKCNNNNCTFKHSETKTVGNSKFYTVECRYGDKCNNDNCTFKHTEKNHPEKNNL